VGGGSLEAVVDIVTDDAWMSGKEEWKSGGEIGAASMGGGEGRLRARAMRGRGGSSPLGTVDDRTSVLGWQAMRSTAEDAGVHGEARDETKR